jgi:1-acyl-sn-glycerol-3-phosphate acyltransferase
MHKAGRLLNRGVSVIFFPEGTRSVANKMGSFHSAAFRLALAGEVAIIPLCICGNERVMPKGSSLLSPGMIRVRQLPPVPYETFAGMTPFALKKMIWTIIDKELEVMEGPR